ncbi:hypothetical protein [Mycobacterium sp. E802]|uniref:hypothetical protein n=1 Tax=Mycobacterium sp. E802 TaxID=1834152 RepID=UPI000B275907|nr:hypothetical protein [Mycobacterium sp. E802]
MNCQNPDVHPDTPLNRIGGTGACRMCAADRQAKFKAANKTAKELYNALTACGVPADAERIAQAWALMEDANKGEPA